jgi:hypothetical protein
LGKNRGISEHQFTTFFYVVNRCSDIPLFLPDPKTDTFFRITFIRNDWKLYINTIFYQISCKLIIFLNESDKIMKFNKKLFNKTTVSTGERDYFSILVSFRSLKERERALVSAKIKGPNSVIPNVYCEWHYSPFLTKSMVKV